MSDLQDRQSFELSKFFSYYCVFFSTEMQKIILHYMSVVSQTGS